MRDIGKQFCACVLTVLVLVSVASAQDRSAAYTWGIKMNGQVCGYADVAVSTVQGESGKYTLIEQTTIFSAILLGMNVDRQIDVTYHIDPDTGQYTYFAMHAMSEDMDLRGEVVVEGDIATCNSLLSDETRQVTLPEGIVLSNNMYLTRIVEDFVEGDAEQLDYLALDPNNPDVPIQTITHTKGGLDVFEAAGETYQVVIIDTLNKVTGEKTKLWINTTDGLVVKVEMSNGMEIAIADPSIRDDIERVDADSLILAKAETDITDISAISSMKVKASLEPVGTWLDVEDLNVPGQSFEGEVNDNRVEGVFEIAHARYDGTNAPPYPPNFEDDESLAVYLASGQLIQSSDPVLIEKAREIAEGSADSWEAAVRLSEWVADNIGYEIPGGVFARKVYDMRVGECGGHSVLLAAFCRGVGIPARGVWGCMYTPLGGGSFGQHAWTEIYMGEAGWIPVDSTAHQNDFVDSGHIRLGTFGTGQDGAATAISLGAKKMEVLDYELTDDAGESSATAAGKYVEYVGAYSVEGLQEPFRVLVKNGSLGINIPGQMVIPMKDPDADGNWACTLTNLVYCSFPRDEDGTVSSMVFHEIVRMRRKSDPEAIADDVPEDMRRYLGGYFLAKKNVEISVVWDEGRLAVQNPGSGSLRHFEPTDEDGVWTIEDGVKEISFILDDDGEIISMSVDVGMHCPRVGEPLAARE